MFFFVSLFCGFDAYIRAAIRLANRVSFWEFVRGICTRSSQQTSIAANNSAAFIYQTDYG